MQVAIYQTSPAHGRSPVGLFRLIVLRNTVRRVSEGSPSFVLFMPTRIGFGAGFSRSRIVPAFSPSFARFGGWRLSVLHMGEGGPLATPWRKG